MTTKQSSLLVLPLAATAVFLIWMNQRNNDADAASGLHSTTQTGARPQTQTAAPSASALESDVAGTRATPGTDQSENKAKTASTSPSVRTGRALPLAGTTTMTQTPDPTRRAQPKNENAQEALENALAPLPAIQLSGDFKLPIIELALAEGALKERSPVVQEAAINLKNLFYKEVAEAAAKNPELRTNTVTDPETGVETVIIEPGPEIEAIKARSNERFRALFGNDKFNAYSMRTAMERLAQEKAE